MNRAALVTLTMLLIGFACTTETPPDLQSEEAAKQLQIAIEVPHSLLQEVTDAGATVSPGTLSSLPFSMLLLAMKIEPQTPDFHRPEGYAGSPPAQLWIETTTGHSTLLPPDSITEVTAKSEGDQATGTFRFERAGLFVGRAEFTARRQVDGWQVIEITIPDRKVSTRWTDDGTWKGSWPE